MEQPIQWPMLTFRAVTPEEFVGFWERYYSGYDEALYRDNIGKPLTEDRIAQWFAWKNRTPLAPGKAQSILRYASPEERLSADADEATLVAFLNRPGGAIWRIFWLHLQHPRHFPIYDQHVHRAMAFLLGWPKLEIPAYNPTKVRRYIEDYRPFFRQFGTGKPRQVDRALWSFGKFLASEYGGIVRADRGNR